MRLDGEELQCLGHECLVVLEDSAVPGSWAVQVVRRGAFALGGSREDVEVLGIAARERRFEVGAADDRGHLVNAAAAGPVPARIMRRTSSGACSAAIWATPPPTVRPRRR